jgi:phosphatidylinositol alpha-mannosyltransferase
MRRMTRVIAVSESARDAMARYARFDSTIIGNGVDCDAFESGRALPRFADGMTNILSLARLEPRNGIDLIIDAFALLARDRPGLRLLLAGRAVAR